MPAITKQDLINGIDWAIPFDELNLNQQADFLSLTNTAFLTDFNRHLVLRDYELMQTIFEERGIDKIIHYLP